MRAKTKQPASQERLAMLERALDALPVAFALFDAKGALAEWNARLAGLKLFPKRLLRRGTPLAKFRAHDAGLSGRAAKPRTLRLPEGGTLKATAARVGPKQLLVAYEDVTEAQRVAERLGFVERAVSEGIYDWDIAGNRVSYSELVIRSLFPQVGWTGKRVVTPQDYLNLIHPEDRERYRQELRAHFAGTEERFASEYRVVAGGQTRWMRQHGFTIRDRRGRAVRMIGASADIDARKQAELALERAHAETAAALERQTVTAEILKVIAASPTDVQPALDAIAQSAVRLFTSWNAVVLMREGERIHLRAVRGPNLQAYEKVAAMFPLPFDPERVVSARVIADGRFIEIADAEHPDVPTLARELARAGSHRALVYMPLLREGKGIGAIVLNKPGTGRLTENQISLLRTFADQAVIAIENVRLFNETKEALRHQTATAEVLQVISSSVADAKPVFDKILASCRNLLGNCYVNLGLLDDEGMVHLHQEPGDFLHPDEAIRKASELIRDAHPRASRDSILGYVAYKRQVMHFPDVQNGPGVPDGLRKAVELVGANYAALYAPLLWEGRGIGALSVSRLPPAPFSEREIRLLKTFADQAVIAIQNARLFNETKEALERQTATAEILKVIAGSPSNAQPVFDAIASSALRLFDGLHGMVVLVRGDKIALASHVGPPELVARLGALMPVPLNRESLSGRVILDRKAIGIGDMETSGLPDLARALSRGVGMRALLGAPMLREGKAIGAIVLARETPGEFSPKQVALLETFANQAVIAIENARLFNETKEALQHQTATAEVLQVISSSVADAAPVFDKILASCRSLFGDCVVTLGLVDDHDMVHLHQEPELFVHPDEAIRKGTEIVRDFHPRPSRDSIYGYVAYKRQVVHFPDVQNGPDVPEAIRKTVELVGSNYTALYAPLLWEGRGIGTLNVSRFPPAPFSDKEIRLLKTFADQAVIAIQNARLFNETKEALERQTATAEILKVIASSPSDVQPVLDAIAASAKRLTNAIAVTVLRVDGGMVHLGAITPTDPVADQMLRDRYPQPLAGNPYAERMLQTHGPVQIVDAEQESEEWIRSLARARGWRSLLAVPLNRGGEVIGTINILRREPGEFSEHQVSVIQTFADQAVIAIENVRLFNETKEALERQTATADILKVISGSPTDVRPVFDAIAKSAQRLMSDAEVGVVLVRGDGVELAASAGLREERLNALRASFPRPLELDSAVNRIAVHGGTIHYPDVLASDVPDYSRDAARAAGVAAMMGVPLLREGKSIGGLIISRTTPGAFGEKQIDLLRTFADQAVIAIENVRLFNETKEALERQTATAEVLQVISSSVADTAPVFDKIIRSCERLFGVRYANVALLGDDGMMHMVQDFGSSDLSELDIAGRKAVQAQFPRPARESIHGYAIHKREVLHYPDVANGPGVPQGLRDSVTLADGAGNYSALYAPMMWEGKGIGAIGVHRFPPAPFADKDIRVLKTFADQAAIAIQNARLFNETKEALEKQTATADILQVLSGNPSDTQPVFDAIVRHAARLCESTYANVFRYDGRQIHLAASRGGTQESFTALSSSYPAPPDRKRVVGRVIETGRVVHVEDTLADAEYDQAFAGTLRLRRLLGIPLLHAGRTVGAITVGWAEPGPIRQRHEDLLKTFADQAVIAIENVRLFRELQARTEALTRSVGQLTALGEVGQALSSTLDLDKVLATIVARAVQLTGLERGAIYEYDEARKVFVLRAGENIREEILELDRSEPIRIGDGAIGRAAATRQTVQVPDLAAASGRQTRGRDVLLKIGARALLAVPLVREDQILGALAVSRNQPGEFPPEVVALLETFATQSAIAIRNARLFREIEEKGRQLEIASQHKSQFLASMSHELRTPLNAILGFNEMVLDEIYGEISADVRAPLQNMQASGKHLLRLINNVLDLAKIEAGRMELALADYSVHDVVASVGSTLQPLAAEKGLEFVTRVPDDLPLAHGDAGRMSQCLLNLAGNSLKFTKQGRVAIEVGLDGERLRFSVSDTGIGIPAEKIDSLFTEFKQTDATIASEYGGSGLGLSITKKFIEMHGGRIWVESEPGKGSTFRFEIPLRAGP